MKADKLQDAVGLVRDDFVKDAEYQVERKATAYPWVKWAAVAACALIALLIAVPALKGKTPEVQPEPQAIDVVEPEPTETSDPIDEPEDEPTDEPVDEPVNEPAFDPANDYTQVPLSNNPAANAVDITVYTPADEPVAILSPNGETSMGMASGESGYWDIYSVFATYDELAPYIEEPIFEAFLSTEVGRQYSIVFDMTESADATGPNEGRYWISNTRMVLDGSLEPMPRTLMDMAYMEKLYAESSETDTDDSTMYICHYLHSTDSSVNEMYRLSSNRGLLTRYEIDGFEVQKYDGSEMFNGMFGQYNLPHSYAERVLIDGTWYEVRGSDESKVDTIIETLAHIAAQM